MVPEVALVRGVLEAEALVEGCADEDLVVRADGGRYRGVRPGCARGPGHRAGSRRYAAGGGPAP